MPIRSSVVLAISACLNAALLIGCADGGSSATHLATTVPAAAQQGTVAGAQATPGRSVHSSNRRTLSVPSCIGFTGPDAFIGINNSSADAGQYSVVGGGQNNEACDSWGTVVGGSGNSIYGTTGQGTTGWGFIGGGFGNVLTGSDEFSAIVAGDDNQVSTQESAIVAGADNSVAAFGALVGAGSSNTIAAGAVSGAIVSGNHNSLSGNIAFIGGGSQNTISTNGQYGAIVSGLQNALSGEYGFIGAGTNNNVSGEGGYIAAGGYNSVSGEGAVIDGGFNSTAAGTFATIPGGYVNSAAGTYSFAAGARASAAQTGTFVWSDGSDGDTILTSSRAYQFLARASGGFTLYTNAASTVGAQLAAGSGTWASLSDRNVKTNIAPLDDAAVLDKVAALPISRWSYKSEHGVRHVGPMAQDFYAAFGVGADDKHITSIDEDGVALAAIKALHSHVNALEAKNAQLRAASTSQSAKITAMQTQLQHLSAQIAVLNQR